MKIIIPFLILLILFSTCLFSQERGFKVVVKTNEGSSLELYKQYRALIIGVSDYLYWPRLPNAVKDAREVASVLKEIGFIIKILENPNSEEIKGALDSLVFREAEAGDGVLIYFAGHGETMKLADGTELGYIIPKDCPLRIKDPIGFTRKAMSMEDIQTYSLQLNSKHLLAVFDSCFSGSIFALGRAAPAEITHKTALSVRQYITAGSADEIVPDKSIFKDCFLDALKGEADLNNDRYVTGSELGMYLESNVVNYSRNAQHPQYGKIRNPKLDKGDFVFVLEKAGLGGQEEIPTPPKAEKLDLSSIEESAKRREEAKRKWSNWQEQMESDFKNVNSIDQNPENTAKEKESAWGEFLRNYNADNPFSTEDEELRKRADQRIKELSKVEIPTGARINLRSIPRSFNDSELNSMLKKIGFFDSTLNKYGNFSNRYEANTINGENVVIDHATGLMWHQSGPEKYMFYDKAKQWIDELNSRGYAGYRNWRLPTLEEALSLLESRKIKRAPPYIDPVFSKKQRSIWTSDIFAGGGYAWIVSFFGYSVFRIPVDSNEFVRPVRSSEKSARQQEEALKRWDDRQNPLIESHYLSAGSEIEIDFDKKDNNFIEIEELWGKQYSKKNVILGENKRIAFRGKYTHPYNNIKTTVGIGVITISKRNNNLIWIGLIDKNSVLSKEGNYKSLGSGTLKSNDGGKNWKLMGLRGTHHISKIILDPVDNDIVYVAALGHPKLDHAERGLYKTINGGKTWRKVLDIVVRGKHIGVYDVIMDPTNNKVLFVTTYDNLGGTGSHFYKTANGGKSWIRYIVGGSHYNKYFGRVVLDMSMSNPDIIYAIVNIDEPEDKRVGIYRSNNSGKIWYKINKEQYLEDTTFIK